MPDPATAAAALQNGEVDWWETPIPDLVPVLKKNKNIKVDIADPLGNIGSFRMNHMHPPFNNVKVRRAVQMALSQEDYMRAVVGDDTSLWKPIPSFFTPGTPLYTEDGGEPLKGKRDIEGAKKLLAEAGYSGQPVTCLVAQDQPPLKAMGEVTADLLKKIGMTVDFVATDWGTVGQRRASKYAAGAGRLGHVPHLACRRRLRQPGAPTSRSARTATRPGSAGPTAPRSRRRSRPGSRPRTSPRRRR